MNDLQVSNKNLTIDSREVAEMVNKDHSHLIRDIETYIKYLGQNPKLVSDDFFIESNYKSGTGKSYKCYEVTEKGCEMIAHKLTGEKGVQFTATYINMFHGMESKLQQPEDSYMIADPIERAKAWIKEQEEKKGLETANKQKDQIIGELKPKADYTDTILKNKGLVTITQIAKDYGMSGQKMNEILHNLKIQYKQGTQWLLYSKHQAKGYTHSRTVDIKHSDGRPDVKMNTAWTQKGRLFLYETLKNNGILPVIEREIEEAI